MTKKFHFSAQLERKQTNKQTDKNCVKFSV